MDENIGRIAFLDRMISVINDAEVLPFGGAKVVRQALGFGYKFFKDAAIRSADISVCGVDPGQVNMGIALLDVHSGILRGEVYQIALPTKEGTLGTIINVGQVVNYVLGLSFAPRPTHAVVENAAYGAPFGQAALATARTAAIITLLQSMDSTNVEVPPPASIRKTVFLNGKMKADVVWPFLGKDASAALSCALYQFYKEA